MGKIKMEIKRRRDPNACPMCGRVYCEYPAYSRQDNTPICPECGILEALKDYFKAKGQNGGEQDG